MNKRTKSILQACDHAIEAAVLRRVEFGRGTEWGDLRCVGALAEHEYTTLFISGSVTETDLLRQFIRNEMRSQGYVNINIEFSAQ